MGTSTRNYTLDIARIVGALAVILLHCSSTFLSNFEPAAKEFAWGNLFNGLSRIGVPLFLMISGALFLDEEKKISLKGILSRNVKNIAIITLLWTTFYACVYEIAFPVLSGQDVSVNAFLKAAAFGHYHLWYLYMIIGLYIITPFLKKVTCKENGELVLFFILVAYVVQFLLPGVGRMLETFWGITFIQDWIGQFRLDFFGECVTYYLTGWYLVHVGLKQQSHRRLVYLLAFLAFVGMLVYAQLTGDWKNSHTSDGPFVPLYASGVFLGLITMKVNLKERTAKAVTTLSKLTFGVYLIHVLLLDVVRRAYPYDGRPALYLFVRLFVVISGSFLVSFVISKIPVLRKSINS